MRDTMHTMQCESFQWGHILHVTMKVQWEGGTEVGRYILGGGSVGYHQKGLQTAPFGFYMAMRGGLPTMEGGAIDSVLKPSAMLN